MLPTTMATAGVTELRRYTLRPGARAELLEVFERELLDTQEDVGMRVGGTYLDRDDPDAFVWMRGFTDMETRRQGLQDFYGGPVWAEHGPAANATMIDSDDVHLLRATDPPHPPDSPIQPRAEVGATGLGSEWVVVEVWSLEAGSPEAVLSQAHPLLEDLLGVPVATWRTETSANTFPRLPVWGEPVLVWSATFPDESAHRSAMQRLDAARDGALAPVTRAVTGARRLRLQPTARSQHPPAPRPARA